MSMLKLTTENLKPQLIAVFLISLSFSTFSPLVATLNGVTVFRLDWLAGVAIIIYVVISDSLQGVPVAGFLYIFIFSIVLSIIFNSIHSIFNFVTAFSQLIFAIILFGALASVDLNDREFTKIIRIWVLFISALSILAIFQVLLNNIGMFGLGWIPGFSVSSNHGYVRPEVIFAEPSFLASSLIIGFAIVFPSISTCEHLLFNRTIEYLLLCLILLAIFFTGSFAGYLTLIAAFPLLLLVIPIRNKLIQIGSVALFLVIFFILAAIIFLPTGYLYANHRFFWMINQRFDKIVSILQGTTVGSISGSIGVRWARTRAGLLAWETNPLFGVGIGQYHSWATSYEFSEPLRSLDKTDWGKLTSLHGTYIQLLAETGLVGTISFCGLFLEVIRQKVRLFRETGSTKRALIVVALSVIVVQLINWAVTFSLIHPMRWGVIGLLYGFGRNTL